MSKEEIVSRAKERLDAWEQGYAIDEIGFADDVRSLICMAAANKAAEEGGLPKTWQQRQDDDSEQWAATVYMQQEIAELRNIIEAGRASRQVANKAEVDIQVERKAFENYCGLTNDCPGNRFEWVWLSNGTYGYKNPSVRTDFAIWVAAKKDCATPPATTGASTDPATILVKAGNAFIAPPGTKVTHEEDQVGASTVLTDERSMVSIDTHRFHDLLEGWYHSANASKLIAHIDQHVAREVAAQAGQVAVPDFRNVTAVKRISDQSLTITFASCASCSKFERAAAPSPAKESK